MGKLDGKVAVILGASSIEGLCGVISRWQKILMARLILQ
jgi:hypothetical protein